MRMNNQTRIGFIRTIIRYMKIDAEYYGYPVPEINFRELDEDELEVLYESVKWVKVLL